MEDIDIALLAAIPHIDLKNIGTRFVSTPTFYVDGEWTVWLNTGDKLVPMKAWTAEGFYFCKKPEKSTDIYFHFLDFIAQRVSYREMAKPIQGIQDDFFNLSASLAKIEHLFNERETLGAGVSRMVTTEVEYIFSVCRSLFDLLQEIASKIWDLKIEWPSQTGVAKKRPMEETFSAVALKNNEPKTVELLQERYGLPEPWAAYYVRNAEFFCNLRAFRDNIIHRGSQVERILESEHGFLIRKDKRPFSHFDVWREDELFENNIATLMPVLGTVILKTILACEDFSNMIATILVFPPPVAPGMRFFMRGYFDKSLSDVLADAASRTDEVKWVPEESDLP